MPFGRQFSLREALFTSVRTVKTGMFVHVSVCVWKVMTFYEEDMRGNHVPVGKGVLNDQFLGFEKFLKSFEIFREKKVLKVFISNPVLNQL